jgi:hypothetical protein
MENRLYVIRRIIMCDIKGCWKTPYCEIFTFSTRKTMGSWSYLCYKHFCVEFKRWGLKRGYYILKWYERIFATFSEFRLKYLMRYKNV